MMALIRMIFSSSKKSSIDYFSTVRDFLFVIQEDFLADDFRSKETLRTVRKFLLIIEGFDEGQICPGFPEGYVRY
jgi:hypothetical protein